MRNFVRVLALGGLLALAACSTAPADRPVAHSVAPTSAQPVPYRWTHGHSAKAYQAMVATFGKSGLAPGAYVWAPAVPTTGDTRVVIDLVTQMAYVYRGERLVGASTISSGKRGAGTPLGFWPILEKKTFYRSRKYNNAPMPFMQRLDEFGIAIHGGANPGYPASHGCVRLPMKFAEKLYGLTKVGSEVVIEG